MSSGDKRSSRRQLYAYSHARQLCPYSWYSGAAGAVRVWLYPQQLYRYMARMAVSTAALSRPDNGQAEGAILLLCLCVRARVRAFVCVFVCARVLARVFMCVRARGSTWK
jgi:hypothetical protein